MESLTHLWILTVIATLLSSVFSKLIIGIEYPGTCQKVVALPLYKPWKGVDQGKEEQGQSLVDLGTASHHLMDREAVTRMSGLHQMCLIS